MTDSLAITSQIRMGLRDREADSVSNVVLLRRSLCEGLNPLQG
jgi:hypothetical protein